MTINLNPDQQLALAKLIVAANKDAATRLETNATAAGNVSSLTSVPRADVEQVSSALLVLLDIFDGSVTFS